MAHRGRRGIALHLHDHGIRRGEGSALRPGRSFPPGKDPVPIVQEAGWAPGPVWTGAENLATIVIRSPDGPARSQSLDRLRYRAHLAISANIEKRLCELPFCPFPHYSTYFKLRHEPSCKFVYIFLDFT